MINIMECIFCKIIKKETPSYTIYEDNNVIAFLDINPVHNGHTLIVPKKHFICLSDIDEKTLSHINKVSKYLYKLLETKLNFDGLTITQNNGLGQEVKHYHMHLIPKYNTEQSLTTEEIFNIITNNKYL